MKFAFDSFAEMLESTVLVPLALGAQPKKPLVTTTLCKPPRGTCLCPQRLCRWTQSSGNDPV